MPNQIDAEGLQTATQTELVDQFTADFESIYGADINLSQDTPDGQMMMIFIQAVLDLEDLLTRVYNTFDPDNATGVVLDQRVAINGIQRQAGTYTITNITLVNSQSVNLYGLDQDDEEYYTVSDNQGNEWYLEETELALAAGTHVLSFRAKTPGQNLTVPNTITIPVTIVLGVDSVNNPTAATTEGINEESDAALKIRRQQSVSLASQGYLEGLVAALENITDVSSVLVLENDSSVTDGDGIPGHSIWVIVGGAGADLDIATAIYNKRNAGCGMYGDVTYTITQVDGSPFVVKWDVVEQETLFIKFTATSLDGTTPPDIAAIREGLVTGFVPGLSAQVNINDLATAVQVIDDNTLVTNAGFCLTVGGVYANTLTPTNRNEQFAVSEANIIILPMLMSPASATVVSAETQTFLGLGGYGAYTYTLQVNNSGATINGSSGLYTAGGTPGSDTVRATDGLGNYVDATVTVPA